MRASILSIGDELTYGQSVDTNSGWISARLASVGCQVMAHHTVPDEQEAIERAIRWLASESDFLVISGGIGPTADDLSRQSIAAVMGVGLEESDYWLSKLSAFFEKRGRAMPASNRLQALIPRGATLIDNLSGTAAGIDCTIASGEHRCRTFAMPGVPSEMKMMFERDVLPHIAATGGGAAIVSRKLNTFGLGESAVAERLGTLMQRGRNPSVGTTVSQGIVSLRLNSHAATRTEAIRLLESVEGDCRAALGSLIYGVEDETLADATGQLLAKTPSMTLATAETVTAGSLARILSESPVCSKRLLVAMVANMDSPIWQIGTPDISSGQSLSELAQKLAEKVRQQSGATHAIGIAGNSEDAVGNEEPGGACAGVALVHPTGCVKTQISISRGLIREYAAKTGILLLRKHLLREE